MTLTPQRLFRIAWRCFFTFAVIAMIVNFSYNGVRCLQGKVSICDKELQEQAEARYQRFLEFKNADKIAVKQENNFWLTIMSLQDNEVIVDVD